MEKVITQLGCVQHVVWKFILAAIISKVHGPDSIGDGRGNHKTQAWRVHLLLGAPPFTTDRVKTQKDFMAGLMRTLASAWSVCQQSVHGGEAEGEDARRRARDLAMLALIEIRRRRRRCRLQCAQRLPEEATIRPDFPVRRPRVLKPSTGARRDVRGKEAEDSLQQGVADTELLALPISGPGYSPKMRVRPQWGRAAPRSPASSTPCLAWGPPPEHTTRLSSTC